MTIQMSTKSLYKTSFYQFYYLLTFAVLKMSLRSKPK